MSTVSDVDPLAQLIEELNDRDILAARRTLERFEPFLRMAVRRRLSGALRAKLDSMDVVQSIWTNVLAQFASRDWRFEDPTHLRAFLVRAVRNRLFDHARKHHRALGIEQPLDKLAASDMPMTTSARPSEVVEGQELWESLLALCPPVHREILRLKSEGRSLAEIASSCAMHPSSVRRILYDLARRLVPTSKMTT